LTPLGSMSRSRQISGRPTKGASDEEDTYWSSDSLHLESQITIYRQRYFDR
jgi:hypothetical protein